MASIRWLTVVCITVTVISATAKFDLSQLSWEVEEQLAELEHEGLRVITAEPKPIYRKDLPHNYIAYWEIELNGTEYVILSSSAKTGDYRRSQEGPLPAPSSLMQSRARLVNSRCERYFMLSPDGQMFCENSKGRVVASTMEILGGVGIKGKSSRRKRAKLEILIRGEQDELQEEWDERRVKVEHKAIWSTMMEYDERHQINKDVDNLKDFHGDSYYEEAVSPGDSIEIPLNDMVTKVQIKISPPYINLTDSDMGIWQEKLCRVLVDVCEEDDPTTVDRKNIVFNEMDRKVFVMTVHGDKEYVTKVLEGKEVGFSVEMRLDRKVILKRFGIDLTTDTVSRPKRHTRTRPWTAFEYSYIPKEHLFPDYWQHSVDDCLSGCGPVAWAMVFGYYDRLAHSTTPHGHSKALWRCDEGGTSGSEDCVAPATLNSNVRLYVEELRKQLETFCLTGQGATPQWSMDNVEDFYCERQDESAYIYTINTGGPQGFFGDYSDKVVNTIVSTLSPNGARLPVVVGYRVGGNLLRQHYAVATKLRRRSRRYRHCIRFLSWCENWKTEWDNDVYLHVGGSYGAGNGWHTCEGFFSAVAYPLHTPGSK